MRCFCVDESEVVKNVTLFRVFEIQEVIVDASRKKLDIILDRYVHYVYDLSPYDETFVGQLLCKAAYDGVIDCSEFSLLYKSGMD